MASRCAKGPSSPGRRLLPSAVPLALGAPSSHSDRMGRRPRRDARRAGTETRLSCGSPGVARLRHRSEESMTDRHARGTAPVVEAQVPAASANAGPDATELGPSRRGWWAGVVAFLNGAVVLLPPRPPGARSD